jgi:hypothetical protein
MSQTAQANLLNISGTSTLADVNGTATPPEALTVSWSVVENVSSVYTYTYVINNPAGDVLLPGSYAPGLPEIVDSFTVDFNAAAPGALVSGPTGAIVDLDLGTRGLFWFIAPPIAAGASSGPLSFTSDDAPTWGNASAADANPPSPWSSSPAGQPVPVPSLAAPDSFSTAALLAGMLPLLALGLRKKASLLS